MVKHIHDRYYFCFALEKDAFFLNGSAFCQKLNRGNLHKKASKKDDIVQKGGRGLAQMSNSLK